jgi:DNA-nicking Smr family endonuclease
MSKKKDKASSPFAELEAMRAKIAAAEAAKAQKQKPTPGAPVAAPPKRPKPAKGAAADEEVAFHRLMSGVVPLDDATKKRLPKTQTEKSALDARRREGAERAKREDDAVHEHLRSLVAGGTRFEVTDDGARVEGRRVDVQPDVVRKLRRGQFPVDARLDMHEMSAGEAREALTAFLADKRGRGERCVLVIHGKGEHSPGGRGVLRGEIAAWLSQGAASHHVAAFTTAQEEDGGEGATYVLLIR